MFVPVIPKTPSLSATPSDATIESGTVVTLTCATASVGTITYKFMQDTSMAASGTDNTLVVTTSTTDTGTYTCVVTISAVDSVASSGHTMTVVGKYIVDLLCRLL